MARIWKEGQGRPYPQGKRKPSRGTAAKIRARKQARTATRAGAKGSEGTVENIEGIAVTRVARSKSRRVTSTRKPSAQPVDRAAAPASPMCDVTEPGECCDPCSTSNSQAAATGQVVVGPTITATDQATDVTTQEARATDQAVSDTDQTSSATVEMASGTNQATNGINQAASATDLYFRIYNKYYGPKRATVGESYASTKQTWHVARIIDRCTTDLGFEYRVLWLCIAEIAGRPDIVSQSDIDDFATNARTQFGVDLTKGTSWKICLIFLRKLRDAGRDFYFKAMEKRNFAIIGRRGTRALVEVELLDGLYLCAAYNHQFVGHAFVLRVRGGRQLLYDQDQVMRLLSVTWINFVAFVRPFITFT
ncbi:hypothetical protein PC120_g7845 [Phytophthora cactorum]|nr:hypothetical protein PC120_g7845 [Phytophthora cactorum]